jgi:hypothetical protein
MPLDGDKIFRWDLDKTYLVSHFESLRGLLAVPFQKGTDKVALPGVVAVIKGLHRNAEKRGARARVFFLSASPPQIGGAIRDKLEIDEIRYEGITFKDQVAHLVRGRFDALREQIGYKLDQLLTSAQSISPDAMEFLFGDDWESDPFVYSLYADVLSRRVSADLVQDVLSRARVHRHYVQRICSHLESLSAGPVSHRVPWIFVLRQRPVLPVELESLGQRVVWFDNYFECALSLYVRGLVDVDSVVDVCRASGLDSAAAAVSFANTTERGPAERAHFEPARRRLIEAELMAPVPAGRFRARVAAWWRERRGLPRLRPARADEIPDYQTLVDRWSHRRRKERR